MMRPGILNSEKLCNKNELTDLSLLKPNFPQIIRMQIPFPPQNT